LNNQEKKLLHDIKIKEAEAKAKAEDNGLSENPGRELEEQQQQTHNRIF
jgi:hypothetical protein